MISVLDTTINTQGSYTFVTQTAAGCDSLIVVEVEVLPEYFVDVDAEICDGESLVLANGAIVENSGDYTFILQSAAGCDSTVTIHLIVHELQDTVSVSDTFCEGENIVLNDGTVVTISGEYIENITDENGCQAVIQHDVTVYPVASIQLYDTLCFGSSLILPNGAVIDSSGSFTLNYTGMSGCDSVVFYNVYERPLISSDVNVSICFGDNYQLPDGTSTSEPGNFTFVYLAENGCDSLVTIS